jgi:N-acetylmuramic acid 6-phosphate (MurNAc-6-P) etherase
MPGYFTLSPKLYLVLLSDAVRKPKTLHVKDTNVMIVVAAREWALFRCWANVEAQSCSNSNSMKDVEDKESDQLIRLTVY